MDPERDTLKVFNELKGKKDGSQKPVCLWFLNGKCKKGDQCTYSHDKITLTDAQKKALATELPLFYTGRGARSKSPGGDRSPSAAPKSTVEKKDKPCKFGKNCNVWKTGGNCPFKH